MWLRRTNLFGLGRRRWLPALLGAYLLTGVYVVRPEQRGVVRCFGRVVHPSVPPGLRYRPPWPLTRLNKVRPRERKRLTIGFQLADRPLGQQPGAAETQFITGDTNLVNLQAVVQYTVRDAPAYLFRTKEVRRLMAAAVQCALTEILAATPVDELLTTGRPAVQNAVVRKSQQLLETYRAGIQVVQVTIRKLYPPAEVVAAFTDVASAREDRARLENEAKGYASDLIPKARGEAQRLISEAEAYRTRKVNQARGEAQRFEDLLTEYRRAEDVTAARLYVEAMEQILPKMKKVIVDNPRGRSPVDLSLVKPSAAASPPAGPPR